jgi:hypothetical protein
MTDLPWLFNDETLADVANRRVALAEAARAEGAEPLIERLSLEIPVYTGMREIKRSITEPFIDRFDGHVEGERFADILNHLRNEAIPYNAELAHRIRAVCAA